MTPNKTNPKLTALRQFEPRRSKTRVLFTLPHMGTGGTERVARTILQHLDRCFFEPHLALLSRGKSKFPLEVGSLQLNQLPEDVEVHNLGVTRARYIIAPLVSLCHRIRPDVVISMSAHMTSAVIVARSLFPRNVRVLARECTDITSASFAANQVRRKVYGQLYRRADKVICLSESMRQDMMGLFGIQFEKTVRIYNPVDLDELSERSVINPYQSKGPNLVVVSRLFPGKRIELLIEAMLRIRSTFPTAQLHIVGWGSSEPALRTKARDYNLDGAVNFVGFQANPYPYLKHADLCLSASSVEGLPNVVLEALALATPVVSTISCGGMHEIADTTHRLQLVPEETPANLAHAAIRALTSGLKAAPVESKFLDRFGLRSVIASYERLIEEVADAASREAAA